jgi:putative SOS response-associated peptidase YedK
MRAIAVQSAVGGMALSLVGMALAAGGYLPPVAGAIAQEVIDVLAVVNALRVALPPRRLSDFQGVLPGEPLQSGGPADPPDAKRMINARADTVATRPAFRKVFRQHRGLIVADGCYEWKKFNGKKQPYYIRAQDGRPFAFAGLWEHWDRGGDPIDSCTILTTDANELVGFIRDRMPVIVDPGDYELWLDRHVQDAKRLEPLLVPCTSEAMAAYPVGTLVNNPKAGDPKCIEPVA